MRNIIHPFIFVIYLLLANLSCFHSFAQNSPDEMNRKKLDSLLFSETREHQPGYCVMIIKNNEIIYNHSTGYANVAKKIPFTDSTKVAIASVTKQFTAMGILLLEKEGKLALEDDIKTYLPELAKYPYKVTIQHLLSHTSGMREHVSMMEWDNNAKNKNYTFEGTLRMLQTYNGSSFLPGEYFAYSNTGYELLAIIIERVAGIPFEEFMQKRIFQPLRMKDTEFSFRKQNKEFGSTASYDYSAKNKKYKANKWKECNATGATGIYTTARDFAHWDYNFSHPIICSQAVLDKMNTSDSLNAGGSINYGNGQKYRNFRGYDIVEHAGGWAYFNCQYTRVPELGLSIIIFANNEFDRPYQLAEKLLRVLVPTNKLVKNEQPLASQTSALTEGDFFAKGFCIRKLHWNDSLHYYQLLGPGFYAAHSGELYVPAYDTCLHDKDYFPVCFIDGKNKFQWSGGSYFQVPRTFNYLPESSKIDISSFHGKFFCAELGTLKIVATRSANEFKVKSSFGSNAVFREIAPNIYESDNVSYRIRIVDENTLEIGDERVFNLLFKKQ